ncbi:hypothetical protein SANT12839_062370 [Streptomyces antimycoticus]|uniref:Uncharacterized protein n=2 Tax=Streptomyces antimycoticus TaxID=68175 RepID=A0A4D4K8Q8_9ACTN|nr:hypothetical protein SANT12839_062370 [Streptomyces antimycoticus]
MKMPDQKGQTFSLTTTFTPNGRPNLGAFMSIDADANSKDYGTIRLLKVTSNVPGPQQVQSELNGDPEVAEFVRNLRGTDSDIEYGNLLTVPLDDGFLYIEPVYARGGSANYPLLKKVGVSYGKETVFKDTLGEALDAVFGESSEEQQPPGDGGQQPPSSANPTVKEALKDAQEAYQDGQDALQKQPQDWEAYGRAQDDLRDALNRAAKAEEKAGDKPGQKQNQPQSQSAGDGSGKKGG